MSSTGDFRDPNWEPSDEQHAALMEDFRRTVLWRKAMAAKGIKVLAMRLSPQDEADQMRKWWTDEGCTLDQAKVSPIIFDHNSAVSSSLTPNATWQRAFASKDRHLR